MTAPATATVSQGVATAVTGIGVAETGTTTGESFSVAVSDTTGVLSATTGAVGGGGTITSSNGGKTLTIAGTLTQVNADLSTLTDNDSTTAADTLSVTATDGFGNSGTKSTAIGVTAANGSLGLSVPGPVTVGVSQSQSIPGVTIAESPVAPGETFSVALSDATGVLSANTSATGGGGTVTPSNGGKTLTVAGHAGAGECGSDDADACRERDGVGHDQRQRIGQHGRRGGTEDDLGRRQRRADGDGSGDGDGVAGRRDGDHGDRRCGDGDDDGRKLHRGGFRH